MLSANSQLLTLRSSSIAGSKMIKRHSLPLLLLFLLSPSSSSFFLPNAAPRDYMKGDSIQVNVNKLSSVTTQLSYDYYSLEYCKPERIMNSTGSLGEVLLGDRIKNSVYVFKMMEEVSCQIACRVRLDAEAAKNFKEKIADYYRVNMILDDLPVASLFSTMTVKQDKVYNYGFSVGLMGSYGRGGGYKYFIYNHLSFEAKYHREMDTDTVRIVGIGVEPRSIKHEYKEWKGKETQLTTCTKNMGELYFHPLEVGTHEEVVFTYDVTFKESEIKWASRWDAYLPDNDQFLLYSTINSLVTILFLSGAIAMITIRSLYKDICNYDQLETPNEPQQQTGWKSLHGDVFRPPPNAKFLCTSVGTGVQVFTTTLMTLIFATLGFFPPYNRGSLITAVIFLWSFNGFFAGYSSSRLHKLLNQTNWKNNAFKTAFTFPATLFAIFSTMNALTLRKSSSNAIPLATIFTLVSLWVTISVPLVFLGAYVGFKKPVVDDPVKTHDILRQIPEQKWFRKPIVTALIDGFLPAAAIHVQFTYIMDSAWLGFYYDSYWFLAVAFLTLIVISVEVAILRCHSVLRHEDHRWWWRSYLTAGSSGLYLFTYSVDYFSRMEIAKPVSVARYFGYMLMVSAAFFALTGSIGFYASLWFVRRIYSSVKIA